MSDTTSTVNEDEQPNPEQQAQPDQPDNGEPDAKTDYEQLQEQYANVRDRGGRAAEVEVNPEEAQQNDADWLEGREPNDVVEVEGQRETAEARMARNGVNSPEKRAGATTLH